MKKFNFSIVVAGLLMTHAVGADPVAIQDGAVFIAGNDLLSVRPVNESVGLPDSCTPSQSVPDATDVVISDGKAFVTSKTTNGTEISVQVTTVDVSSCLADSSSPSPSTPRCDAEPDIDLAAGVLHIPCLEANGETYDIIMHQRGGSTNWEVTGVAGSSHRRNID